MSLLKTSAGKFTQATPDDRFGEKLFEIGIEVALCS
jgi:hypothetical protein